MTEFRAFHTRRRSPDFAASPLSSSGQPTWAASICNGLSPCGLHDMGRNFYGSGVRSMSRFALSMSLALFSAAALSDTCDNLINNQQAYRECVIDWYGTSNRSGAPAPWWKRGIDQGTSPPPSAAPAYQPNDPRVLEEIRAKARRDYEYNRSQNEAWNDSVQKFAEALSDIEGGGNKREAVFLLEKAKLQQPHDQKLIDLAQANLDAALKSPRQNPATLQPLLARLSLSADDIRLLTQFRILLPVYLNFWSRIGVERYPAQFKYIHDFSYIADACVDERTYLSRFSERNYSHIECLQQRYYKGLFDMERKLDGSPRDLFFYVLTARAIREVLYGDGGRRRDQIDLYDVYRWPDGEEKILTKRIDRYEKQLGVRYERIQTLLATRADRDSWDVRVAPLYFPEHWQGVDFRNERQVTERFEQLLGMLPQLANYKPEYAPLFLNQNSIGVVYKKPGVAK